MELPQPRVALGLALRGLASSAIDLSDGLAGDLRHVLRRSQVGAVVDVDALPVSAVLAAQAQALRRTCQVTGGDDYELLFTAAPQAAPALLAAAQAAGIGVTRIGRIEAGPGLRWVDANGRKLSIEASGFDHFSD